MACLLTTVDLCCRPEAVLEGPAVPAVALTTYVPVVVSSSLTAEEHMRSVKLGQLEVQIGKAQAQLHATRQLEGEVKRQLQQAQRDLQEVEKQKLKAAREVRWCGMAQQTMHAR